MYCISSGTVYLVLGFVDGFGEGGPMAYLSGLVPVPLEAMNYSKLLDDYRAGRKGGTQQNIPTGISSPVGNLDHTNRPVLWGELPIVCPVSTAFMFDFGRSWK